MKTLSKTNQKDNPWEIVKSFFTYNGEDYDNLTPTLTNSIKNQDRKPVYTSASRSKAVA